LTTVALLQGVVGSAIGQESPLAIVISTLLIAALFAPLRRWLQALIDKRFYRRKYDAEKALDAFNAIVRDEVDLEGVTAEIMNVVAETVQPAHSSLWLAPFPHDDGKRPQRRAAGDGAPPMPSTRRQGAP
jgi:hypothetical protein